MSKQFAKHGAEHKSNEQVELNNCCLTIQYIPQIALIFTLQQVHNLHTDVQNTCTKHIDYRHSTQVLDHWLSHQQATIIQWTKISDVPDSISLKSGQKWLQTEPYSTMADPLLSMLMCSKMPNLHINLTVLFVSNLICVVVIMHNICLFERQCQYTDGFTTSFLSLCLN